MLVPNLFVQVPVDAAIRGVGALPLVLRSAADERVAECAIVVVDLAALGAAPGEAIRSMRARHAEVLAFAPHVEAARLREAREAGAVALARGAFLTCLPELLATGLGLPAGE
jgi:hypothetical protein